MSQPEESGLERDYCAGQLSLRDLAEIYGISEGAIRKRAKKYGWVRSGKTGTQKGTQVRKSGTQKSKVRTTEKPTASAEELVSESGLTPQQSLFVAEYLIDQNATAAAERAGYSDPNYGRQLLTNPNVKRTIESQLVASVSRTLANADDVLAKMWQLATFDANEISQYRHGACRHCWGFGHHYQWRDAIEHEEKCAEAKARNKPDPPDKGGYGYDQNADPNPDCPRCNGDGIGRAYFPDTRKLSGIARLAYSGTKVGKNGVEITAISREKMFEAVMKRLGLADSELAQRLQRVEIDRRRLEVEKLGKELADDDDNDVPKPVAININVVDAKVRDDDSADA
ncbi:TPA: terminase small subunit [Serratia liquefaciens]|nr:terminase small subunit [Serratia liquefaciens]